MVAKTVSSYRSNALTYNIETKGPLVLYYSDVPVSSKSEVNRGAAL